MTLLGISLKSSDPFISGADAAAHMIVPLPALARRIILSAFLAVQCGIGADAAVLRVDIDGAISPITATFIKRAVAEGARRNSSLLLVRLKTPGGLGISMQEIVETVLNSPVPVAVYVAPSGARAASAGFFILLAADVAAMAPGTNTGAAHPIFAFGGENKVLLEKITNDALANLRSIAEKRGRNTEMAEKGVRESLSFTESEALRGGLIDLVAQDEQHLLRQIDEKPSLGASRIQRPLSGQPAETLEMTFREKLLSTLADPNLAVILGIIGLLGIYVEFTNPGLVLPGVAGTLALLLALLGFSVLPINYVAVILILLALGLFVAEVTVQGFGVLGIGGVIALVLGLLFLVQTPNPDLRVQLPVALGTALPFALIFVLLLRLAVAAHARRVTSGPEAMVGQIGVSRSPISTEGKVFVFG
ncbi:MAG: nodulation protein NfeD, partial [Acidobacteria bacterium]|nr:nodulation protein NfeD [Acidobacteriota bacterium]